MEGMAALWHSVQGPVVRCRCGPAMPRYAARRTARLPRSAAVFAQVPLWRKEAQAEAEHGARDDWQNEEEDKRPQNNIERQDARQDREEDEQEHQGGRKVGTSIEAASLLRSDPSSREIFSLEK